uniref:Uncharacterized protein n=1 Tax=Glossina palpalis gambiensis TaxID=67801 RepID=A0A1B0ANN2_9MUSC
MYLPESSESPVEMRGPAEPGPLSVYTLYILVVKTAMIIKKYVGILLMIFVIFLPLDNNNVGGAQITINKWSTSSSAVDRHELLRASDRLINLLCKCPSTETAILVPTTTTTTTTITTIDKQMAAKCCKSPLVQAMPSFLTSCSFQTLSPGLRHDLTDDCCRRRTSELLPRKIIS